MIVAKNRPRAVLFDLWGTLIYTDLFDLKKGNAAVLERAENRSGATLEELQAMCEKVISSVEPWEGKSRIEFSEQCLLRILSDSFGLRFRQSPAELEWIFWSNGMTIKLMDGAASALAGLRGLGIRSCVVSNSSFTAATIEKELARLGILGYFDFVASSADYGVRKPDGILFDVALRRLGVPPGEAWFIGDNILYDVEGPWDRGIFPVLYDMKGETAKDIPARITEYQVISHWGEFLALIEGMDPGNLP
jgi:putative hydrolase of the HAD superfamily